jgi:branched-subunit amino acid aminotransferase/4-amino-4-deoxychorismate lyase
LLDADEIFITGTAIEIMPISNIDNKIYKIGEITKQLIALFKKEVK